MKPIWMDLVTICYQAHEETIEFFESVAEHADVPYRMIAVVNPGDRHQDMLDIVHAGFTMLAETENFSGGFVIINNENVGYAKAVNRGVAESREAGSPIIAVLNNDVKFLPGTLSGVVDVFNESEDIAIVGPKQIDSTGKLTHGGIVPIGNGWDQHRFWMEQDHGQADDEFDAPMVSGSAMFTRRDIWEDMTACPQFTLAAPYADGAFLPTPHFFEETYYCYHVRLHGYRCRYTGKVSMIHEWHRSTTVGSKDMEHPRTMFIEALKVHGFSIGGSMNRQLWPRQPEPEFPESVFPAEPGEANVALYEEPEPGYKTRAPLPVDNGPKFTAKP
jgi:GT2 family glycosyltransferase